MRLSASEVFSFSPNPNLFFETVSAHVRACLQKHFRAIVGVAQEQAATHTESVLREIDTLTDHLRVFSTAVAKLAHLQNVLGARFQGVAQDLGSFGFQLRRHHVPGAYR